MLEFIVDQRASAETRGRTDERNRCARPCVGKELVACSLAPIYNRRSRAFLATNITAPAGFKPVEYAAQAENVFFSRLDVIEYNGNFWREY